MRTNSPASGHPAGLRRFEALAGDEGFELFASRLRLGQKAGLARRPQAGTRRVSAGSKLWLGMRDSNPRWRDQNPLPYHLANPQQCARLII